MPIGSRAPLSHTRHSPHAFLFTGITSPPAPSVTASMAESPVIGVAVGVSVGAVVLLVLIIAVVAFL